MSFVAVSLAAIYPFMKRHTHLPQVVLGMAFGWAIPMAYMALQGSVPLEAWVLFGATVIWALIYDTMYAMVDRDDDLKVGIKSTAILFGRHDRLAISPVATGDDGASGLGRVSRGSRRLLDRAYSCSYALLLSAVADS